MTTAVRYYSRSGNTKAVAEAVARAAGVRAISVDSAGAGIDEPVDVLFVGGALYAYGIDSHLREYLDSLDGGLVGEAVVFSTSWVSKHAIELMREALRKRGVSVDEETLHFRGKPNEAQLEEAEKFARKLL
jgi:flavodoxin